MTTHFKTGQIPLDLLLATDYSKERFVTARSNVEAVSAITRYPNWAGGALAVIGPKGSGKTHLGHLWIARHDGILIAPDADLGSAANWRGCAIWVDEAELANEDILFGLINMAIRKDIAGLLLTGRTPPAIWPMQIPDLRSRLGAMQVARIEEPGDDLLEPILRKLFLDRGLKVSDSLINYLLSRIERSVDAANSLVEQLDKAAAAEKANVTRSFAINWFKALE